MDIEAADEGTHAGCTDEWWFGWWLPNGSGGLCGHRHDPVTHTVGYWWTWRVVGEPILHISDWEVPMRSTSGLIKGELLWAEHLCESPHEQWTVSNESRATAVDDPSAILAGGFGDPTPIASDLEWYSTTAPTPLRSGGGYQQSGVVHGVVEVAGRSQVDIVEAEAWRSHRWWSPEVEGPGEMFRQGSLEPVDVIISGPGSSFMQFGLDERGWLEINHLSDVSDE